MLINQLGFRLQLNTVHLLKEYLNQKMRLSKAVFPSMSQLSQLKQNTCKQPCNILQKCADPLPLLYQVSCIPRAVQTVIVKYLFSCVYKESLLQRRFLFSLTHHLPVSTHTNLLLLPAILTVNLFQGYNTAEGSSMQAAQKSTGPLYLSSI